MARQRINWDRPCLKVGCISTSDGLPLLKVKNPLADLIELRLDSFIANNVPPKKITPFLRARKTPVLLTLRTSEEGGDYHWKSTERRHLFEKFLPLADAIDIELKTARYHREILSQARRARKGIILSAHCLKRKITLGRAERWYREFRKYRANVYKVATLARTKTDLEVLIRFQSAHRSQIAVMAMGPMAALSRVVLPLLGSRLVYGYLDVPAAENQPSLQEIAETQSFLQNRV